MPKIPSEDDYYSDKEAARRATEALRRSLTTPHRTQKEMVGKTGRAKLPRGRKPPASAPES